MVKDLSSDYPLLDSKQVVVVDGGIATQENLTYLKENGYEYIVAGKRQSRNAFYNDFCNDNAFSIIPGRDKQKAVEISRTIVDEEHIVLCRSAQRKAKEDAILSKYEEKYINALNKLNERLKNPKSHLKSGDKLQRAIGKISSEYSRASKFYEVTYNNTTDQIEWERADIKYEEALKLNGCYFLKSSLGTLSPEEVWKCYTSLTKVEHAFEMMKTFLGIRPGRQV
jgi:hypothetical protein